MCDEQCLKIAESAFRRISERLPSLRMERDDSVPVELSFDIPTQPGLRWAVNLNLQNRDELHFSVGNFWLAWFPCTDEAITEAYVDAVSGFLAGRYRVLEHYRGGKCVKAELQAPGAAGDWQTIGYNSSKWWWFPGRKRFVELINI